MEQFFNWLINAPVWIQSTLLLLVLLPICAGVAVVLLRLSELIVPPSDNERRLLLEAQPLESQYKMQDQPHGDHASIMTSPAERSAERN